MPSQQQVRWSQLRVGITVLAASIVLAILIFLMTGSVGLFTKKILLRAYFENAEGLRVGAPVRLEGVDIGNVVSIRVTPNRGLAPVEVTMKVSSRYLPGLHKDSLAVLSTAGVLGETFVDISSRTAKGPQVKDGEELSTQTRPDINDMVRASQSTLQNIDVLIKRVDRIVSTIESGQGSIGKVINDPELYNRLNQTLNEMQQLMADINAGKGALGKFTHDEAFAKKLDDSITNLNALLAKMNDSQGSVGKLFNDPSLYTNSDQMMLETRKLVQAIRENPKKYLTIRFRVF